MADIETLQLAWEKCHTRHERREAGQFFTPRWVARGMARWVVDANTASLLDPAFGFGMLVDECLRQGFNGHVQGYELDAGIVRNWRMAAGGGHNISLVNGDFHESGKIRIEAAIANPPYNRFQNRDLPPELRQRLSSLLGQNASGYTNQYALFLYEVISQLELHGRAAFIVPSEFLATGYGIQVKRFLIDSRRLQHLILFDTANRIFPEATTTACVLLFGQGTQATVSVSHLSGIEQAERFHAICAGHPADADIRLPYEQLDAASNWQNLGLAKSDLSGFVPLCKFGRVKRGIATGANEFFALGRDEVQRLTLSDGDWHACISSADSAPRPVFDHEDWEQLARSGRPACLFDGSSGSTAAKRYIRQGEAAEFHLRYLTSTRTPWYRLEQRPVAPLLLAVFGRNGFRAVLNRAGVANLTAYHGFHPNDGDAAIAGLLWLYLQTPLAHAAFVRQQRSYGDGLKKLEPGDWNQLLVPDWSQWPKPALQQALQWVDDAVATEREGDKVRWEQVVSSYVQLVETHKDIAQRATDAA